MDKDKNKEIAAVYFSRTDKDEEVTVLAPRVQKNEIYE
jgi:hypothetical protein